MVQVIVEGGFFSGRGGKIVSNNGGLFQRTKNEDPRSDRSAKKTKRVKSSNEGVGDA